MVSIALDKLLLIGALGLGGYAVAKHFNLLGGDDASESTKIGKSGIMRKQVQPFSIIPYFSMKTQKDGMAPLIDNNAATIPNAPSATSPSSKPHTYTPPPGSTPETRSDRP